MSIQTFTIGQTLTAAQMSALQANDYNQTVSTKTANYTLVAADKGTRVVMNVSTASTITVNTSLFSAGDTVTLQNIGSNASVVTPGTATVSTAGSLSIPQFGSGILYFTSAGVAIFFPSAGPAASSGLTLIKSDTVTAGATVSVLNAFSTTYDFYSMRFSNLQMANDNVELRMQLGSSGSADTGSNYNSRGYSSSGSLNPIGGTNESSFLVQPTMGTTRNVSFLELSSPFLSSSTFFTSAGVGNYSANVYGSQISGVLKTSTSYTDMFFSSNSGNVGPFTYALYGYAKS